MDTQSGSVIRPNSVLLATDGSKDATLAARVATDLSKKTGAALHVAHDWRHHVQGLGYPTVAWADYSYIYEKKARRLLEAQVDSIESTGDLVAEEGDKRKTLLAVGNRGLGVVGRTRLGSVSTNVLRAAHGPVLIYSKPAGEITASREATTAVSRTGLVTQ
jgi:nucleotide-binding universal stress UspA family protein